MGKKDARVDAYIGKAAPFAQPVLKHLRDIVHRVCPDASETIKWQMPFFEYKGNLCHMAAFKQHCAFGFWKGRMIFGGQTSEGMGQLGKISGMADLPGVKTLEGFVKQAMELNETGAKPPARTTARQKTKLIVPKDFLAALKKNPKAQKTFEEFPPSHKREYVDWITEAKREETRERRIRTAVEWMASGKSRNWKYEKAGR